MPTAQIATSPIARPVGPLPSGSRRDEIADALGQVRGELDHSVELGLVHALFRRLLVDDAHVDLGEIVLVEHLADDLVADVELLRETGRLMFLRMLITQDGAPVAASTATIRKASVPR